MKVDATSMHVEVKGTVTFLESVTKLVALANAVEGGGNGAVVRIRETQVVP